MRWKQFFMNIIQAREAAMAGNTVISPSGLPVKGKDFQLFCEWFDSDIFGEWSIKKAPVVFEAEVSIANETLYGAGIGMIASRDMRPLIGKRVKVTVEVLP